LKQYYGRRNERDKWISQIKEGDKWKSQDMKEQIKEPIGKEPENERTYK